MKILRLSIRNIASVEKGDIDFENGLVDKESGSPASLFLITGDTGSGKSVVLDSISMALYGTTPRVKGVNGVKNNTYRNSDGEEISVSDITQYTRIGISWKDDCYSELTFEGNDGIRYTSRFSLGRTSRRNYRRPEWRLTIGNSEVIENRKDEIRERIQKAVGLTFEQFSRMAMLAQGQFATFLTGKKEERERILEQLTATDIFSRYGEAISNIYKRTRQEKETSARVYEEFGKKILSEEDRANLQSELEQKQHAASLLRENTEKIRREISHIEAVLKAEKDIMVLKAEDAEIRKIGETPEFRKKEALIDLWDKTERERNLLSDKLETMKRLASDFRTLQEMKSELIALSGDLDNRIQKAEVRSHALEKEKAWLKTKDSFIPIYNESSVTIHRINSFLSLLKETASKEKEFQDGNHLVKNLLGDVDAQEKSVREKSEASTACRHEIIKKSEQREALDPVGLRKESERLISRRHSLNELSARILKAETDKAETDKAQADLNDTSSHLSELNEAAALTLNKCQMAEKRLKEAEDRYLTMHLSVDKNFSVLRIRLAEEHATNCPLCGQSITEHLDDWKDEGYFSALLSPLEEEKNILADAYFSAKKAHDEAEKIKNTTAGSLRTKEAELKKMRKSLERTETEILVLIRNLDLPSDSNLPELISCELAKIDSDMRGISEKLADADKIQQEIDSLIKNKESLDKVLREAESMLQKSIRILTKRKEATKNARARLEELAIEMRSLRKDITESLKGYADEWESNPSAEAARLMKDAEEFTRRSSTYSKDKQEQESLLKALQALSETKDKLVDMLDTVEWEAKGAIASSVDALTIELLEKKWNGLLVEVTGVLSRRADNERKIKDIDDELKEYYQVAGTTETTLHQLLGAGKDVNEARSALRMHRDKATKNEALLSEAIKSKEENLKALGIEELSQTVDVRTMKSTLAANEKQYAELEQQSGLIKGRIEADEKSRKQSEMQKEDLERKTIRFEKWEKMNRYFGGTRFRTLVQSHILRPLLNSANIYLRQITDHYTLTCSDENEQLSILVLDRYNNNEPRSATVLSGGERFMISLALSLALSTMNRPDMNVNILFIDEGFGTLDAKSLEMVMATLRRLPEINGQNGRRVGVISHREELTEQIGCRIQLHRHGQGRSRIEIHNQ